ncbi:PIG-L deacetylase family protein [Acidobacterium sp. S8]|uniref:PIG-L deacetylase family protein n=1 Tax=Acidobacterium sp. S8 TaxID=1641854 RepID=UPI00131E6BA1|nr:PIG-L deacetylase family protein [Acidobacterium sp. S8]
MISLNFDQKAGKPLKVLCIGAHSDDIEIGCGGTILQLAERYSEVEFHWAVFSAIGVRESEAQHAASLFAGQRLKGQLLKSFQDGFMPFAGADVKAVFEQELKNISPDLIFTHNRNDAHQDHRLLSQLAWNTFRSHLILEYEIPKYDGDMGQPNCFVPLTPEGAAKKVQFLMEAFQSQRTKHWFDESTFQALMRLRGMECNAPSGYAEAFYGRKLTL